MFPRVVPEGVKQHQVSIQAACSIAGLYLEAGFNVVMNDVLIPENYNQYREFLVKFDALTVLLMPPLEVVLERAAAREKHVPQDIITAVSSD